MYTCTFTTTIGFPTPSNILLINEQIAARMNVIHISTTASSDLAMMEIVFNSILSDENASILYSIVSTLDNPVHVGAKQLSYSTNHEDIASIDYTTVITLAFPGSNFVQNISHIKVSGYMDEGGTEYYVRLFDVANGTVMASGTFSNTDHIINDLSNIANIPVDPTVVELQCKTFDTNTVATIRSLTIYYD